MDRQTISQWDDVILRTVHHQHGTLNLEAPRSPVDMVTIPWEYRVSYTCQVVGNGISGCHQQMDLKMDGWKTIVSFLRMASAFRCKLLVSGSVHPLQVFNMERRKNEWLSNKDSAQGAISSSTVAFWKPNDEIPLDCISLVANFNHQCAWSIFS